MVGVKLFWIAVCLGIIAYAIHSPEPVAKAAGGLAFVRIIFIIFDKTHGSKTN